jgi:FMN-dependent NADH-azoreductase
VRQSRCAIWPREPLPHIGDDFVAATRSPSGPQTDAQRALLARSDELVDELSPPT